MASLRALSKARSLSSTAHPSPFSAVDAYRSTLASIPAQVHAPLLSLSQPHEAPEPQVVPLPSSVFLHSCHPSLFHLLVRQHLAGLRAGTASTKSRSEVNYSGRKIRPQKGTGRARLGDRGSPMLRGGGRAFAKKPKDWSFHVNRKMVDKGLKASLSLRWVMSQLDIVDSTTLPVLNKTRDALSLLEPLNWTAERGTLCFLGQQTLASEAGQALSRSTRNIQNVTVADTLTPETFNVYELLKPSKIVMDLEALNEVVDALDPVTELSEEEELLLQQALSELSMEEPAAEQQIQAQA